MTADDEFDPVIARLQAGALARQLREAAGVALSEADKELGGYLGKLSKIETGIIAPRKEDVVWMISRYGVDPAHADELRELAADARRRAKPAKIGSMARQYVSLERQASDIRMCYAEIPGLLQTEEYAFAALSMSPVVVASSVAGQARERADRGRRIIRPDGPDVWIALGEDALHRSNGGPDVLRRQLEHLRSVAEMPNVRFRVLERSSESGIVAAMSCPFTLLRVESGRTVAYIESLTRSDYLKASAPYVAAFDQAWNLSATEGESAAILERRITSDS